MNSGVGLMGMVELGGQGRACGVLDRDHIYLIECLTLRSCLPSLLADALCDALQIIVTRRGRARGIR